MDGKANLPAPPPSSNKDSSLRPPINISDYSSSHSRSFTSTSSSSSSPPDFLRHVQAAFKRHRPLGKMQSNNIRPMRLVGAQRETSKDSDLNAGSTVNTKKIQDDVSLGQRARDYVAQTRSMASIAAEAQEDASVTPPFVSGTSLSTQEESFKQFGVGDQPRPAAVYKNNDSASSLLLESEHVGQKKVHFALENNTRVQGADGRMTVNIKNLMSHMDSLALTEMECDVSNQMEASSAVNQDIEHNTLRSDGQASYSLAKGTTGVQDQLHQFRNFLQGDLNHHMTQSSVVGSSCPTTTLMNSASAPMHNSTTYCSYPQQKSSSHVGLESLGECDVNAQPMTQPDKLPASRSSSKYTSGLLPDQLPIAAKASSSALDKQLEVKELDFSKGQRSSVAKECKITEDNPPLVDKSIKAKAFLGDVTDIQSQAPLSENPSSDVKLGPSKPEKQEKVASSKPASAPRKKGYDPDLFFKVNGKLYQRLGKIGSGGSSEVHKVISSDCKIYALKKIKLKGRDYATAYGFCQEIEYLNKLKGKDHIIQLIDYEVTDKALLQEVMHGSMSNKDRRVSDDGYIYMVLEYGEIDLAHMLSQKWKELDSSISTIDENWLRFYWQQILLAVNTIHEERIVHSDLKPANFLLVRGSLKLIDFGIAKAIMSDTTNIQRDSQVGTLSYMSPEAFMCNDTDANGNIIKCGRSSDIWSLGCILYQMVYGRTPFSDYKTFWAKYKVITDPNHEITFEPVPNPYLLDLMKKCLSWDSHQRWRIPQLLTHPFLVPPNPTQLSTPQGQNCKLLQLVAESCKNDQKALMLCHQVQELLGNPLGTALVQPRKLLYEMSNLCFQLQERLSNPERD